MGKKFLHRIIFFLIVCVVTFVTIVNAKQNACEKVFQSQEKYLEIGTNSNNGPLRPALTRVSFGNLEKDIQDFRNKFWKNIPPQFPQFDSVEFYGGSSPQGDADLIATKIQEDGEKNPLLVFKSKGHIVGIIANYVSTRYKLIFTFNPNCRSISSVRIGQVIPGHSFGLNPADPIQLGELSPLEDGVLTYSAAINSPYCISPYSKTELDEKSLDFTDLGKKPGHLIAKKICEEYSQSFERFYKKRKNNSNLRIEIKSDETNTSIF